MTKPEKKSETLEVRLPLSQKKAFMAACRRNKTTASDAVRGFVDDFVTRDERTPTVHRLAVPLKEMSMTLKSNPRKSAGMALGLSGLFLALGATPSLADDDLFAAYDKNADGVLTRDELPEGGAQSGAGALMTAMDADQNGKITPQEFLPKATAVSVKNEGEVKEDGMVGTMIHGKRTDYDLTDPEDVKISVVELKSISDGDEAAIDDKMAEMRTMLETGDFGEDGRLDDLIEEAKKDGSHKKKIRRRIEKRIDVEKEIQK
ncbi:MAG: hypothetical protein ACWA5T_03810 [Parvularcula sp.]